MSAAGKTTGATDGAKMGRRVADADFVLWCAHPGFAYDDAPPAHEGSCTPSHGCSEAAHADHVDVSGMRAWLVATAADVAGLAAEGLISASTSSASKAVDAEMRPSMPRT